MCSRVGRSSTHFPASRQGPEQSGPAFFDSGVKDATLSTLVIGGGSLRQPKRRPVNSAQVAVYLDANIASVMPCRSGCRTDKTHLCLHRFGSHVYVFAHQSRIALTRLSDLQVILDFVHLIKDRWDVAASTAHPHRYVILTQDRRFLQDARNAFLKQHNMRKLPLWFRSGCVSYTEYDQMHRITIEVQTINIPTERLHAGGRCECLREAIAVAKKL